MTFDYYTVFFAVMGIVIVGFAFFALRHLGLWADQHRTLGAAVVFVLGGSLLMYGIFLGVTAAFTQQVSLVFRPAFLFVPAAFALAAAMVLMKRKTT